MIDRSAYPGQVASAAPRLALDFARERGGDVVARRVADDVAAQGFDLTKVAASTWTPYAAHLALVEAVEAEMGEETLWDLGLQDASSGTRPHSDVLWDLGVHNARNAHRFVPGLAALLAFVKPKRLIASAPLVWRTYADFGEVRSDAHAAGGKLEISGFKAHPAFCGTLGGFFAGLLTRVGAHACAVEHTACMMRGAKACVFTGTWT